MRVLLIGGGGREDALAWAIGRSPLLTSLDCAPGNAGTSRHAKAVELAADDLEGIVDRARREKYDLVVVGPEAPLVAGLADRLEQLDIPVFGCSEAAAIIEGSKVFSKRFMDRHDIPTARFEVFSAFADAEAYLAAPETRYPLAVKADGLAAGKGVVLADDATTAIAAARSMLEEQRFGDAGSRILVEDALVGREVSIFVLTDGERIVELATAQDYKRIHDRDEGPNTGGMGTYSPSVYLDTETRARIMDTIVRPTIQGLASEERTYRGVLYTGVMLTEDGPQVLEYNARFGDPETQVLLPRLDGDWLPLLHGCATGRLPEGEPRWRPEAAVCVVMAAGGYPGSYAKGARIDGLDAAEALDDVIVFHAGTSRDAEGRHVTSGGRVLGVTALGSDLAAARDRAYRAVGCIHWDGEQHRSDIAEDALHVPGDKGE